MMHFVEANKLLVLQQVRFDDSTVDFGYHFGTFNDGFDLDTDFDSESDLYLTISTEPLLAVG